ncbi:unnamed protein product, partial [marine sediment metagenome]
TIGACIVALIYTFPKTMLGLFITLIMFLALSWAKDRIERS